MLIYYGYKRFITTTPAETTKKPDPEEDHAIIGFNLRAAIQDLQKMQMRVMAGLSEATGI